MFVTNLPARIVESKHTELAAQATLAVGNEGLGTKIKAHAEGIVLTSPGQKDKTAGYRMSAGEVIEFSGCVDVYNTSGEASAAISLLITDTV